MVGKCSVRELAKSYFLKQELKSLLLWALLLFWWLSNFIIIFQQSQVDRSTWSQVSILMSILRYCVILLTVFCTCLVNLLWFLVLHVQFHIFVQFFSLLTFQLDILGRSMITEAPNAVAGLNHNLRKAQLCRLKALQQSYKRLQFLSYLLF